MVVEVSIKWQRRWIIDNRQIDYCDAYKPDGNCPLNERRERNRFVRSSLFVCYRIGRFVSYLKMFFRISLVTLRVAVLAAVLAALPMMEPEEELFLEELFLDDEVLPVIFLPTEVPT